MRGLNSKIGQSTVVIKTVCCFPRKALSSALLTVSRAVHDVEERTTSVQTSRGGGGGGGGGGGASYARPHQVLPKREREPNLNQRLQVENVSNTKGFRQQSINAHCSALFTLKTLLLQSHFVGSVEVCMLLPRLIILLFFIYLFLFS